MKVTNDLEKKREYARQWRAANPDKVRAYRERTREANREAARRYYHENRAARLESMRLYRQANPDKVRERNRRSYQANREREIERKRQRRADGYLSPRQREHAAVVAELWAAQGERCYLCEETLALEAAVLEHDHRCCPKMNTYCSHCIRGAACMQCNTAIGLLRDDPDLLERIAVNLRAKLADTGSRISAKPVQATLDEVI